jgi:hypothetical protein
MRVVVNNPTCIANALYNVCSASGASDDYARGMIVGVVSALMAVRDDSFESVAQYVASKLPVSFDPKRLPEAFAPVMLDFLLEAKSSPRSR